MVGQRGTSVITTARGEIEAGALVTPRVQPLAIDGRIVYQVGLPYHFGIDDARLYDSQDSSVGGTHAIFIFRGEPEEYNLPAVPDVSTVHLRSGWQSAAVVAGLMLAGVAAAFFTRD